MYIGYTMVLCMYAIVIMTRWLRGAALRTAGLMRTPTLQLGNGSCHCVQLACMHMNEVLSLPPHLEYDAFADSEAAHIFAQMHGSKLCKAIQHANTTNTLKHHISE